MSMFRNLQPGTLGIRTDLAGTIELATNTGWQGIDLPIVEATRLVEEQGHEAVLRRLTEAGLQLGGWGLPIDWRGGVDETQLDALSAYAAAAQRLGCTRTYTWLMPASDDLPFHTNFDGHVALLQPVARVLAEHGCNLGLEFIGPRHMREQKRYGFIYSLEGMLCLARAIGANVGLLLDSYHWYTSLGTLADIRALRAEDVVYVHVNDAPSGVPVEAQHDQIRRLPGATGVIDLVGFLETLREIGYDGPVTPEPFDQQLKTLSSTDACQTASDHLGAVWAAAGMGA